MPAARWWRRREDRGLDARVMRGEAIAFMERFDAVFSNAALHWMPDLDAVFAGVARALKPGGRFVAEMGGEGNVATVVAGARRRARPAWAARALALDLSFAGSRGVAAFAPRLPDPGRRGVRAADPAAGRSRRLARDVRRRLPRARFRWPSDRPSVEELRAALRPLLHSGGGWTLDYVRLRFAAHISRRVVDGEVVPCVAEITAPRSTLPLLPAYGVIARRRSRLRRGRPKARRAHRSMRSFIVELRLSLARPTRSQGVEPTPASTLTDQEVRRNVRYYVHGNCAQCSYSCPQVVPLARARAVLDSNLVSAIEVYV